MLKMIFSLWENERKRRVYCVTNLACDNMSASALFSAYEEKAFEITGIEEGGTLNNYGNYFSLQIFKKIQSNSRI